MTQKIYNLVYFDRVKGLRYISIYNSNVKGLYFNQRGNVKEDYHLEEIDNVLADYSENQIKDILRIKSDGHFLIISKRNNTYYKRHVIFDDPDIVAMTSDLLDSKNDVDILNINSILDDKEFVSYLNQEGNYYSTGDKKGKDIIHKLDSLYKNPEESLEKTKEIYYLKKYYTETINSYLKYRDFYVVYRDYTDKQIIDAILREENDSYVKRKEEELLDIMQKYDFDEIDKEQYMNIKNSIMSQLAGIRLQKEELYRRKKRIIKK